jgi:ribonucleoside-diphosphate reductase alpha chain
MVQGHDYVKMATSVIDYIFRDLAISYLKRTDLGQIKPEDLLPTGTKNDLGGSAGEDKSRQEKTSAGFRPHGTAAPSGGGSPAGGIAAGGAGSRGPAKTAGVPANSPAGGGAANNPAGRAFAGTGPQAAIQTAAGQKAPRTVAPPVSAAEQSESLKIAEARIKGYEGDPCPVCGSFTLVRNGTCMKCDTCGGTTGCS